MLAGNSKASGKKDNTQHKQKETQQMKRLMIAAALASASMLCSAATYEENFALASTPIGEVNKDNVEAVCNAALAVTNGSKIVKCRAKGLLTFEQVAAMVAGKEEFSNVLYQNALFSSNDVLRTACVDSLLASAKIAPAGSFRSSANLAYAVASFKVSPARRIEIGRELIAAGKLVNAIQPIYGSLSYAVYKGKPDPRFPEYGSEYTEFCAEVFDQLYAAWISTEPTVVNGRLASCYTDGSDIMRYAEAVNASQWTDSAAIAKISKYVKDGQNMWTARSSHQMSRACREAALASTWWKEGSKIKVAARSDSVDRNKKATEALYPTLKDDANKVKVALYLGDNDKLIDALKTISDKLDAETVNSVIIPLNGIDAGYRTADLRLALMNINKKYTLKLYDDRDTWEPILSKVRAMIDAL